MPGDPFPETPDTPTDPDEAAAQQGAAAYLAARLDRIERLIAQEAADRGESVGAPATGNMSLDVPYWSRAVADVLAECRRQIDDLGWTADHDDHHDAAAWTSLILGRLAKYADLDMPHDRRRKYLVVIASLAIKAADAQDRYDEHVRRAVMGDDSPF